MKENITVWAWLCNKPHGGFLLYGNSNADCEYRFGNITDVIAITELVCANTKRELLELHDMEKWNRDHPQFRVRPARVTVMVKREQSAKGAAKGSGTTGK